MGPQRRFRKGDRVKITTKIFALKHRKNTNGRIIRVNGYYIYVRPMWCKWELELYPNEIKLI